MRAYRALGAFALIAWTAAQEDAAAAVARLTNEVARLNGLVSEQNARIAALEARTAALPASSSTKGREQKLAERARSEQARREKLRKAERPAPLPPVAASPSGIFSPHLRLVGSIQLAAPLAGVAMEPAAAGSSPRFVVAADELGQLHVFDSLGRALMPAVPVVEPPSRVLGMAFLSAGASDRAGTPAFFAVAFSDFAGSKAGGFALCIYRMQPASSPTPERRTLIEAVREANVSWPSEIETIDESGTALGSFDPAAAAAWGSDSAGDAGLVHLDSLSTRQERARERGASSAALVAVRTDGTVLGLSAKGEVVSAVSANVDGVILARRQGGTLALVASQRLVLIELFGRAGFGRGGLRECPVPESLVGGDHTLSSVAFDAKVPQVIYAAASDGSTLVYNIRARPGADEAGDQSSQRKPSIVCQWLDTLSAEAGSSETGSSEAPSIDSIATTLGYILRSSDSTLSVHNVTSLYRAVAPQPAALVHSELLPAQPQAGGGKLGKVLAGRGKAAKQRSSTRRPRALVLSGGTGDVTVGVECEGGRTLRLYVSSLPYDAPTVPLWPKIMMAVSVIVTTLIWQLCCRKKAKPADGDGRRGRYDGRYDGRGGKGRPGRARPDQRNLINPFDDDDADDPRRRYDPADRIAALERQYRERAVGRGAPADRWHSSRAADEYEGYDHSNSD